MSVSTQLHQLGMGIRLMARQLVYVSVVLFIMMLRLGRRTHQRTVSAAIFSVTRSQETRFCSQVSLLGCNLVKVNSYLLQTSDILNLFPFLNKVKNCKLYN